LHAVAPALESPVYRRKIALAWASLHRTAMHDFTPLPSLVGGALIGLSASILLLFHGRVAGISGIVSGLLAPKQGDISWRLLFVVGLLLGGLVMFATLPSAFASTIHRSTPAIIVAGLLVGFGTRLSNGCTSGHGVCGNSRLSPRSMVATVTFITTGGVAAFVVNHLLGGSL